MATRAEIREDFIKRLFAVAISIGVATSFVGMQWVRNGVFPTMDEWEHLAILATGMFATVLSWDGYLYSINAKPLNGTGRFTIDIVLVFIYMFLIISSQKPYLWLPLLALIFCLYVWWDILTVREFMPQYDQSLVPAGASEVYRAPLLNVLKVYGRGFISAPDTDRGPVTSLMWALYFLALAALNYTENARYQVFVTCAFAWLGLWFYRHDKKTTMPGAKVRGYPMLIRAILVIALICAAAVYFCRFRISSPT